MEKPEHERKIPERTTIRMHCLDMARNTMGFRHESAQDVVDTAALYETFVLYGQAEVPRGEDA